MPVKDNGADAAEVQRLLAKGNSKSALEAAKLLHKRLGTPATESLLVEAYLARARSMLEHGLAPEAQALLALVVQRYPSAAGRVKEVQAAARAEAAPLEELLRPLNDPALSSDERAAIERAIRTRMTDPAMLARSAALDAAHPLRMAAAALERAFQAVTSGPVEDAAVDLPEISRRSPLAPWKPLLRAIACFYRRDDAACEENLGAIEPGSAPARLAPVLRALLSGDSGKSLRNPAAAGLVSQAGGNFDDLRGALRALDDALETEETKTILRRIREAVSLAQQRCPEMVKPLRQHIAVRAELESEPSGAVASAMGGAVARDAQFSRMLARGLETGEETLAFACMTWEEFRRNAIREGWFRAEGPEAAVLYLHMAELAASIPEEEIDEVRAQLREQHWAEMQEGSPVPGVELPFLDAGWLYERACMLDPHAEAFERWLAWAERDSSKRKTEAVAQAWRRALPNDPRPLLRLMRDAEKRKALKKALGYLGQAEALDGLNPEVRRARFRLPVLSAIRYLEQRKPRPAERELLKLQDLPQAREGNRPACLAALRRATCLVDGDTAGAAAAQAQVDDLLGGRRAGALAATGIAGICGLPTLLPEKAALGGTESWIEAVARACAVGNEVGFDALIPESWQPEIFRELRTSTSFDAAALHALGRIALRQDARELAYAISAAGLARGGAGEARFLLLRARALPEWFNQRRDDCLGAAIELARRDRDMDLVGEALAVRREGFMGWLREDAPLSARRLKTVLDQEHRAREYPTNRSSAFEDFFELPPRKPRRRKKPAASSPLQEELF